MQLEHNLEKSRCWYLQRVLDGKASKLPQQFGITNRCSAKAKITSSSSSCSSDQSRALLLPHAAQLAQDRVNFRSHASNDSIRILLHRIIIPSTVCRMVVDLDTLSALLTKFIAAHRANPRGAFVVTTPRCAKVAHTRTISARYLGRPPTAPRQRAEYAVRLSLKSTAACDAKLRKNMFLRACLETITA